MQMNKTILSAALLSALFAFSSAISIPQALAGDDIPDLKGTWSGNNDTVSKEKGFKTWKKTIHITEQQGRRFKGNFTYAAGHKEFFGVIYPDNKSFTWVNPGSRGYNHGRILDDNTISACYVEAGIDATAGCATLEKKK